MSDSQRVPLNIPKTWATRRLTPFHRITLDFTGLLEAAKSRNYLIMEKYVSAGGDINIVDDHGNNILHHVLDLDDEILFGWLLAKGAAVNAMNNQRLTPFFQVVIEACCTNNYSIVKLCLNEKASIDIRDDEGFYLLHFVASTGSAELLEMLIRGRDFIDHLDNNNFTPLMSAIQHDKPENAKLLIKSDADINAVSCEGLSVLHYAVEKQAIEVVRLLIVKRAMIDFKDQRGWTPLMLATEKQDIAMVRILIKHGADVNTRDKNLGTPLHRAAKNSNLEIVKELLDNGAENLRNCFGKSSVDVAAKTGYLQISYIINQAELSRNAEGILKLRQRH